MSDVGPSVMNEQTSERYRRNPGRVSQRSNSLFYYIDADMISSSLRPFERADERANQPRGARELANEGIRRDERAGNRASLIRGASERVSEWTTHNIQMGERRPSGQKKRQNE